MKHSQNPAFLIGLVLLVGLLIAVIFIVIERARVASHTTPTSSRLTNAS